MFVSCCNSVTRIFQHDMVYGNSRCISTLGRTIFALSSGRGKCGVAVVRVSGPQCGAVLSAVAGEKCLTKPRLAQLRILRDAQSKEMLDKGIVLWFPGPRSFTGEDTCEFQVHGGLAVVSGLLETLGKMPGLFPADPGEFSKRAFFNGSMDLTEAEGLADLIHAETEMQRKQALHQMSGSLHTLYNRWRTVLLQSLAHVEAYIDFSEDENIEDDVINRVEISLKEIMQEIQSHLADGCRGQRLRDGVSATIVGEPNVGKSSLLNLLCKKPAAIVTSIAGTTRDVVEQYINVGGYPLSLADTAGLRGEASACDLVEREGMARARLCAQSADIVLFVIDSRDLLSNNDWLQNQNFEVIEKFTEAYLSQLDLGVFFNGKPCIIGNQLMPSVDPSASKHCIVILSKIDLIEDRNLLKSLDHLKKKFLNVVPLSCLSGEGLPDLLVKLKLFLEYLCGNPHWESPALSQVRHRKHLTDTVEHIQNYLSGMNAKSSSIDHSIDNCHTSTDLAITAENLRRATYHLGKITGHVTTEQILDIIFRDFCIGK